MIERPEHLEALGPTGSLGQWTVDHGRLVAIAWAVVALALAVFAPRVESALSGAGWQANGSESVQARTLIQDNFRGLSSSAPMVVVHSARLAVGDSRFDRVVARAAQVLRADSQ